MESTTVVRLPSFNRLILRLIPLPCPRRRRRRSLHPAGGHSRDPQRPISHIPRFRHRCRFRKRPRRVQARERQAPAGAAREAPGVLPRTPSRIPRLPHVSFFYLSEAVVGG